MCYLKYIKKTYDEYRFKEKYKEYSTTVYYSNKSNQICIYDKEEEKTAKNDEIQEYERNVLRYELRLTNKHLNYIKNRYGITKVLINYLDEKVYKKYLMQHFFSYTF
ncbi:phage/plasmid replication domain-containing protein [Thermobrachium celere]|uniref:phage/plasmid replication domain-containing protein n=1 Tax=Thermobrachium celere TaxID=53422 RepID=UPI001940E884|nr:phage/plasmid replication protein [Thermobrachium celere]GFR35459.1 hypothetical protein TCEA9_12710 [Thermobrachium celere]